MSDTFSKSPSNPTGDAVGSEIEPTATPSTENPSNDAPTGDAENAEPARQLSLDVTFEILRNRRRQLVLEYLREHEGTVTIGELAEHIAAIENDIDVRQLNAQQRKRVYIGLYQCHLPKMDDVDVVDFNQSRGRISPGEHIDPLYQYLDVANGEEDDADETGTDAEPSPPFDRQFLAGAGALTSVFFVAQLSGAYMIASAAVVSLILAVLVKTY